MLLNGQSDRRTLSPEYTLPLSSRVGQPPPVDSLRPLLAGDNATRNDRLPPDRSRRRPNCFRHRYCPGTSSRCPRQSLKRSRSPYIFRTRFVFSFSSRSRARRQIAKISIAKISGFQSCLRHDLRNAGAPPARNGRAILSGPSGTVFGCASPAPAASRLEPCRASLGGRPRACPRACRRGGCSAS